VQGDGVLRLAVKQRPTRSVEPGIFGEGAGMEVEAPDARCGDDVGVNEKERVDVEEEIDVE
jgi:hypothetical protein